MKFYLSYFVISLLMVLSCTSKKVIDSNQKTINDPVQVEKDTNQYLFDFQKDLLLSPVLDKAAIENKMVFLNITASWCVPCKLMQRDVFTHPETADFFNKNFINYMVDMEKNEGPDLKLIYGVTSLPTLLFLDYRGRIIYKHEGALYQAELVKTAKLALDKFNGH